MHSSLGNVKIIGKLNTKQFTPKYMNADLQPSVIKSPLNVTSTFGQVSDNWYPYDYENDKQISIFFFQFNLLCFVIILKTDNQYDDDSLPLSRMFDYSVTTLCGVPFVPSTHLCAYAFLHWENSKLINLPLKIIQEKNLIA